MNAADRRILVGHVQTGVAIARDALTECEQLRQRADALAALCREHVAEVVCYAATYELDGAGNELEVIPAGCTCLAHRMAALLAERKE